MRYILDSRIALRSWQQVPYAYYWKGSPYAKGLKKEEFELLRSCDGKREQEADDLLETMAARGFIHLQRGRESDRLAEIQTLREPVFSKSKLDDNREV